MVWSMTFVKGAEVGVLGEIWWWGGGDLRDRSEELKGSAYKPIISHVAGLRMEWERETSKSRKPCGNISFHISYIAYTKIIFEKTERKEWLCDINIAIHFQNDSNINTP